MNADGPFVDQPQIETERLLLRKLTLADAADVFEYAQDPEVARYVTWEPHQSIDSSIEFIRFALRQYEERKSPLWGLVLKQNGKLIGTISLMAWSRQDRRAEAGYAIGRRYWGQGFTTEALRAVLGFGFHQMELNRVEAFCEPANIGSARVMEKAGMKLEGVLRQYMLIKGRHVDLKLYSILSGEL